MAITEEVQKMGILHCDYKVKINITIKNIVSYISIDFSKINRRHHS